MKKILFTINFLTNGGPTRVLENIINGLINDNYDIYILTIIDQNDDEIVQKLEKKNIKIISLKYTKSLKEILKNKAIIINEIEKIQPDIIHTHGIVTTLIVYNIKTKAKKVTTIHNNIFEDYKYTYGYIKGPVFSLFHIYMLKKFNEVICCSKTSYNVLKPFVKKCKFIRNGIDIESKCNISRDKIRKSLNIDDNDIVYIYVGVINSRKRVCQLINLFNNSLKDNEHLIIVGDGPLMNKAKTIATNKNIKFIGFKDNVIDYLNAADIYTSYSSSEGFSISVIEALECNLLLLLSDIASHKECFEIDNTYYIGEYFNTSNFITKKINVSEKVTQLHKNKEFKEKYLSSNAMSRDYKKIYKGDENG